MFAIFVPNFLSSSNLRLRKCHSGQTPLRVLECSGRCSRRRAMRNRVQELTMAALVRYDAGLDDALYASAEGGAEEGRPDIAKRKLEKVLVVGDWLFQAICLTEKTGAPRSLLGRRLIIPQTIR